MQRINPDLIENKLLNEFNDQNQPAASPIRPRGTRDFI